MSELKYTEGPWEYIASTEHHGPYVAASFGDVCDCYTMSNPTSLSVRNGGESKPIHFQADRADANARLIAAAPDLLEALEAITAHFADVMGGPMIAGRGVNFANGVDGIPTIVAARTAIAKAKGE